MPQSQTKRVKPGGLDINQQINFLQRIDFFENFDDHELRQLLEVTKWLKVQKGEFIIKENTRERAFYILVKGEVSVVKTLDKDSNRAVELTILKAGACFGEMSLVMDVKRTAGVITKRECFLLLVEPAIISSSNVFLQLKFYKRFCEILVSRLILANDRLTSQEKTTDLKGMQEINLPKNKTRTKETKPPPRTKTTDTTPTKQEPQSRRKAETLVFPALPEKKDRIVKGRIQRRLSAALDLPVNPAVINIIKPLIETGSDNTRLFADYIQLDPTLSCKVLQVANSSFFRRTTPVGTVPHAMITVGVNHIQETLTEIFNTPDPPKAFSGFEQVASLFWRHSVVVARIATLLTDAIRLSTSADIYLAGLLHDVGVLGLNIMETSFYPHIADHESVIFKDLLASEKTYIGIDHGQAGAWFGESIGMPEVYLDVMKMHHNPEGARNNSMIIAIVHLADLFATIHGYGFEYSQDMNIDPVRSFGWVIIQEQHRPFLEVNIPDFINTFNQELEATWSSVTDGLNF